ncbi:MAG: ribosomal protein S18-alanine N-acetyltransferase [Terriglobia bacterium]
MISIRQAARRDVSAILSIQDSVFEDAVWRDEDYRRMLEEPGSVVLVAEDGASTGAIGYATVRAICGEAEILHLAVNPAHQHAGVGKAILQEVCRRLRAAGAHTLYLEVRPSNAPALALYRGFGFTLSLVRKGYYRQPVEDAYVLSLALGEDQMAAGHSR